MSSFSPPRRNRLALTAIILIGMAGVGSVPAIAATAPPPAVDIVAVNGTRGPQVSLVARVQTAAQTPVVAEDFTVSAGGTRVRPQVTPLLREEEAALGLVIDASAPGSAVLQDGVSGAASLLLQVPPSSWTMVVADTDPPKVLAPPATGPAEALRALSSVRPAGERATAEALSLAARELPEVPEGCRVVVLYTAARDAGDVSAMDLARQLVAADVVLAVVSRTPDSTYWSQVATATGGVLITPSATSEATPTPGPSAVMAAFDDVGAALRSRYELTFTVPGGLPSQVSVALSTKDGQQVAQALVSPGQVGSPNESQTVDQGSGGMSTVVWYLVLGAGALLAIVAVVMFMSARRNRVPGVPEPEVTPQRLEGILGSSKVLQSTVGTEGTETPRKNETEPAEGPAAAQETGERAVVEPTARPAAVEARPERPTSERTPEPAAAEPAAAERAAAERAAAERAAAERAAAERAAAERAAAERAAAERAAAERAPERTAAEPEPIQRLPGPRPLSAPGPGPQPVGKPAASAEPVPTAVPDARSDSVTAAVAAAHQRARAVAAATRAASRATRTGGPAQRVPAQQQAAQRAPTEPEAPVTENRPGAGAGRPDGSDQPAR
jgi:hypothetical protein